MLARSAMLQEHVQSHRPTLMHPDTRAVHGADLHDTNASAVASPIYLSTTFKREPDGSIGSYLYSRYANPNRDQFEKALCEAEGGQRAYAFASGLAACSAVLQCLQSGDRVIIPDDAYYGLRSMLTEIFSRFGIGFSMVDMTKPLQLREALQEQAQLVWLESPSNPLIKITDIAALCAIAKEHAVPVLCDNTWATPYLQQPIPLGCDMVLHSVTKYIGGHSDVLMGALVCATDDEFSQRLRRIQMLCGAVPSPFECYLAARGLQTLPTRLRAACRSAERFAQHFASHPDVESVLYPGLPSHPQHNIAAAQMHMPGAMMSIMIRGSEERALAVAASLQVFSHATSLGSVESLVEHRKSVEPADSRTPGNLLRFSIGLEAVEDLIADLEQGLSAVRS